MEVFFPEVLLELLLISATISIVIMAVIQKFKSLSFINKDWHIWILNLLFSALIGIPFAIYFYELNIIESIWVAIFSFVGAPTLYETLRNQNIINYKPNSLGDKVKEIKRT